MVRRSGRVNEDYGPVTPHRSGCYIQVTVRRIGGGPHRAGAVGVRLPPKRRGSISGPVGSLHSIAIAAAVVGALVPAAPLAAPAPARPPTLQAVVDCRKIEDGGARLACYDAAVASMTRAEESGDLVAIDRSQRQAVRRQTFGFALPTLAIFDRGEKPAELNRVQETLASAWKNADGKWVFKLQSGAVWRQIDDWDLGSDPHPGSKITIKRASLGSYMLDVDSQPGLRVHRDE